MSLKRYTKYKDAEFNIVREIVLSPDFITNSTFEIFGSGFILTDPSNNRNERSNYEYAEEFFKWMLSGEKRLSEEILKINPWVERFVSGTGLPAGFSASYGWKIKSQLPVVIEEIKKNRDSRRGYIDILTPEDQIIITTKTTHEYPCTIGMHVFVRENMLHMMVNMRSNNVWAVMPYDVYNATRLLEHLAEETKMQIGYYYHQINSAHIYMGDVRRLRENLLLHQTLGQ